MGHLVAPASRPLETSCLQDAEVLGDLPQEGVNTITSARTRSTRHAYALKLNLFVEWCSSHREDPGKCPIRVVLSFLQQRLERRLSPSNLKSNQIKSLLLSHHHSTSALVSEILMSVQQTVQKNNRQFTYGQTVQKTALEHLQCSRQCKKKKNNNSNLHMDRQCKKATAIYIWTVHIYRLYRRQCAKYTYIYSVHIVYYKDILNYQRHIIHRMGTSTLCTVSIHNVVYA